MQMNAMTKHNAALITDHQQLLHRQHQLDSELHCLETQMLDASAVCDDYAQVSKGEVLRCSTC